MIKQLLYSVIAKFRDLSASLMLATDKSRYFAQPSFNKYCICYSPAGRSVLGETVPEVLSTPRGRRPRAVLRSFRKILLQPPAYVC